MTLKLPHVTLIAIDGPNIELTIEAINRCREKVTFADTILFSEVETPELPFRVIRIGELTSATDNGLFWAREVHKHIQTLHVLKIEWDSWILYPEMWTDAFMDYDYIGATWPGSPPDRNIGNGGFLLTSKRLMQILKDVDFGANGIDYHIGGVIRPQLEEMHGIRFPSVELANRFAYERPPSVEKTFGFHGLYNFPHHLTDDEMVSVIEKFTPHIMKKSEIPELRRILIETRKQQAYGVLQNKIEGKT